MLCTYASYITKTLCCHGLVAALLLQEYTVRERAHTEAAVAYAYDAERGVQMRSCGTQAHGNTAAVQADITAFGMTGEHCRV
jgi:hypothetical protein